MYKMYCCLLFLSLATVTVAQPVKPDLSYYLPSMTYNPQIPTPAQFLGHEVGEWHVSHDRVYAYMLKLAELSDRITVEEYARSYEMRPLILLTITSPANHRRLPELKQQHLDLEDVQKARTLQTQNMPVVLYQGFSIHGNEASGVNAGLLLAYYLAAGQSAEINTLLDQAIILFDPCFNPDGVQRFSTWVNQHKSYQLSADPVSRELNEVWPGGRFNHYWFDLNRDWLLQQHPESRGRVAKFQEWKPNILTDHHEQGSNATYFFMPGVPSRVHRLTPPANQTLTKDIAAFHVRALDSIRSLYFTEENYDDYYYGKGSTYPDMYAGIGILFEQASSRGHNQETANGLLTFPFTIRNQVNTGISTYQAAIHLRTRLLNYQRDFYQQVAEDAARHPVKYYVFGDAADQGKVEHFLDILQRHQIEVFELKNSITKNNYTYRPGEAFIVPLEQKNHKVIRAVFETVTDFTDSIFYDISTWTLPYAFNLVYTDLDARSQGLLGSKVYRGSAPAHLMDGTATYAYILPWQDYYAPAILYQLMAAGYQARVTQVPFTAKLHLQTKTFPHGSIVIPVPQGQDAALHEMVRALSLKYQIEIDGLNTGYTEGVNLGSPNILPLTLPKIVLFTGNGVSPSDAGEVWHLLDQRMAQPVTLVDVSQANNIIWSKYNVVIMADGNYGALAKPVQDNLRDWISKGGTLIALEGAANWATTAGLAQFKVRKIEPAAGLLPYDQLDEAWRSNNIPGSIFMNKIDLTHPLGWGYTRPEIPVFRRGNDFWEQPDNKQAAPVVYTSTPYLSGFVPSRWLPKASQSAGIIVNQIGRGRVISFVDNPVFRAFWFGTNKLLMNAIWFGRLISPQAVENVTSPRPAEE